jgi:putative transposase
MKKHPKSLYGPEGPDRKWIKSFVDWYNDEHLHSAIRFVTPNARHGGIDRETLANRAILYATARAQNQQRWSGKTRNWQPAGPV